MHGVETVTAQVEGQGRAAREVVRVNGYIPLVRLTGKGDDQLRVRDIDLATWLGFERPRDIRQIIFRHFRRRIIRPLVLRGTIQRSSADGKNRGTARVAEYWLNEKDALFVVTQSETSKATAITKQMIDMFVAAQQFLLARDARRAAPPAPEPAVVPPTAGAPVRPDYACADDVPVTVWLSPRVWQSVQDLDRVRRGRTAPEQMIANLTFAAIYSAWMIRF